MTDWIDLNGKEHAVFWLSDSKHEVVIGYETTDSHNGSDPSTSQDSSGFSMKYPVY
jgi:hypothetical protein